MFRSRAERKVADAGYDPARLPPGQYLTEKWPVLHAGTVPETDLATWDFKVFGEVESPVTLSWDELQALPSTEIELDIHCVTRWSRFDARFRGVHWSELAKLVKRALMMGRENRSFTDRELTSAVPTHVILDHVPLPQVMDSIVTPMAKRANYLEPPPAPSKDRDKEKEKDTNGELPSFDMASAVPPPMEPSLPPEEVS